MAEEVKLDDLIVEAGQEFDNTKFNTLAYEDNGPVPGAKTTLPTSDDVTLSEEDANTKMVEDIAMEKIRREKEALQKMSDDEKIKKYILDTEYRRNINDYFNKYHYEMTGQQKRVTRHKIERALAKGKYKLTEEQRQSILFELNKYSNQSSAATMADVTSTSKSTVTSLSALIH